MFLSTGVGQKVTRMQLFEFLLSRGLLSQASTLNVRRQMVNSLHIEYRIYRKMTLIPKFLHFRTEFSFDGRQAEEIKLVFFILNGDWLIEVIYGSNVVLTDKELYTRTGSKRSITDFEKSNIRSERRRREKLVARHPQSCGTCVCFSDVISRIQEKQQESLELIKP